MGADDVAVGRRRGRGDHRAAFGRRFRAPADGKARRGAAGLGIGGQAGVGGAVGGAHRRVRSLQNDKGPRHERPGPSTEADMVTRSGRAVNPRMQDEIR